MTAPQQDVEVIEVDGRDLLAGAEIVSIRASAGASLGGRQSYRHVQSVPAETWLIFHDLPFAPSGIQVTGPDGQRLYPLRTAQASSGRTRLEFSRPVSGTADLS